MKGKKRKPPVRAWIIRCASGRAHVLRETREECRYFMSTGGFYEGEAWERCGPHRVVALVEREK